MPVLEKIVNFGTMEKIAENKTFNNMSETEGFEWPYPQYNSAIHLLNACYDLLTEAGFTNVSKDIDAQSLTVLGLKLFFVNTYYNYDTAACPSGTSINIAAPGVNYPYYKGNLNSSKIYGLCNTVLYNHFLQSSVIDYSDINGVWYTWAGDSNKYFKEKMHQKNYITSPGFHGSVFIKQTNGVYSFAVTLRCSNDNIVFTIQVINNVDNTRAIEQPLFSIFKGQDIVNQKDILVLGKTLERAPFFYNAYYDSNSDGMGCSESAFNYFNQKTNITNIADNTALSTSNEHVTPYYSALICSGSNIIYHTDDLYTPLPDTLYLDWKMNKNGANSVIEKGNAYGNQGKYMLNGVNEIISNIPVTQGRYYDLDAEKFWCKHDILKPAHGCYSAPFAYNQYDNLGDSHSSNRVTMYIREHALEHTYNLFGHGAFDFVNLPAATGNRLYNRDKQTTAHLLNPAILIRIDDEITED